MCAYVCICISIYIYIDVPDDTGIDPKQPKRICPDSMSSHISGPVDGGASCIGKAAANVLLKDSGFTCRVRSKILTKIRWRGGGVSGSLVNYSAAAKQILDLWALSDRLLGCVRCTSVCSTGVAGL